MIGTRLLQSSGISRSRPFHRLLGSSTSRKKGLQKLAAAAGVGAAVCAGVWLTLPREKQRDVRILLGGLERAARTGAVMCIAVADYKYSMYGVGGDSGDYKEKLSAAHLRSAERMLAVAQSAAGQGIYVKAGQHVCSLRPAIPEEYTSVLSVLHDDVQPRPFWEVVETLELALGAKVHDVFINVDPVPLGCASLAQVHRATLLDGRVVAVKVQHRHMDMMVAADFAMLKTASKFVSYFFPDLGFDWIIPKIEDAVMTELDFRQEAHYSECCEYNFRHNPRVYVPQVYREWTSSKVLVMEMIEGVKINDREGVLGQHMDPHEVSRLVAEMISEQVFCHGLVHCDPHPGNILVRPLKEAPVSLFKRLLRLPLHLCYCMCDSVCAAMGWGSVSRVGQRHSKAQIVLLDHGLYRKLDDTFRLNYCKMYACMIAGDRQGLQEVASALTSTSINFTKPHQTTSSLQPPNAVTPLYPLPPFLL
jgi:aarF domain-containing kinase